MLSSCKFDQNKDMCYITISVAINVDTSHDFVFVRVEHKAALHHILKHVVNLDHKLE